MNALIINTYGGSLLLGARQAKVNVVATMEDSKFGSDLQALNFPKIPRYESRTDWPEKFAVPWRDIDVVAHPPCSAFSTMNYSNTKSLTRGTGTSAFACHQSVIDYALGRKARTLTIESVMGAYEGAHDVYEENAVKYGYSVSYIMLNSASFGVPQWRERVWVVFHKLGKRAPFRVELKPEYVAVKDVLEPNGTSFDFFGNGVLKTAWAKARPLLKQKHTAGTITSVLGKMRDQTREDVIRDFGFFTYINANPVVLDRNGFSPVLLQGSIFCDGGRTLTIEEYCAIMGFPRDYKWGKQLRKFRMYLSKGVCPPVAAWIMKTVDRNASGWTGKHTHEEADFGGVIDLRVKKSAVLALVRGEEPQPSSPPAKRERGVATTAVKRAAGAPRGRAYAIANESLLDGYASPQAAFIVAALKKRKGGLTRAEVVALAIADPKNFPTNQPHDRAVGFWLSKLKSLGGLRFAE